MNGAILAYGQTASGLALSKIPCSVWHSTYFQWFSIIGMRKASVRVSSKLGPCSSSTSTFQERLTPSVAPRCATQYSVFRCCFFGFRMYTGRLKAMMESQARDMTLDCMHQNAQKKCYMILHWGIIHFALDDLFGQLTKKARSFAWKKARCLEDVSATQ